MSDPPPFTPDDLTSASFAGDLSQVRVVIDSGVDVNSADSNGVGALLTFHPEVIRYLLSRGAEPDHQHNENGATVLAGLAYANQLECVKLLLEHGADSNLGRSDSQETPLHHALANNGSLELVQTLLQHGADANARTVPGVTSYNFFGQAPTRGETPLHRAAAYASREVVETLLDAGAERSATDSNGYLACHWAGWHMRPRDLVETLSPLSHES